MQNLCSSFFFLVSYKNGVCHQFPSSNSKDANANSLATFLFCDFDIILADLLRAINMWKEARKVLSGEAKFLLTSDVHKVDSMDCDCVVNFLTVEFAGSLSLFL